MKRSLKTSLAVYMILAMLISTFLALGVSAYTQSQKVMEDAQEEALTLASSLAQLIQTDEASIEDHMLAATRLVAREDARANLTNDDLKTFVGETKLTDINLASPDGIFTQSTTAGSVGFDLFKVAPVWKPVAAGQVPALADSIKLRAQDNKTVKFLGIPRADGKGMIEVALAVDSIAETLGKIMAEHATIQRIQLIGADTSVLVDAIPSGTGELRGKKTEDAVVKETLDSGKAKNVVDSDRVITYMPVNRVTMGKEVKSAYLLRMETSHAGGMAVILTGLKQTSLITLVLALVVGLGMYFVVGRALRPVNALVEAAGRASAGDLSSDVTIKGTPELEALGRAVSDLIKGLRESMSNLATTTDTMGGASESMQTAVRNAAEVMGEVDRHASQLNAGDQERVSNALRSMEQFKAAVEQLATAAGSQAEQVQHSNEAVMSMVQAADTMDKRTVKVQGAASELAAQAGNGGRVIRQTVQEMAGIESAVAAAADRVEQLGEVTGQIGEITAVIAEIADQTNLLALNAAIEAARAGEQGRGFAVVADEVRRLAERAAQSSRQITDLVTRTQGAAREVVDSMQASKEKVAAGSTQANSAGQALDEILRKVNETVADLSEMQGAATAITDSSRRVAQAVEALAALSEENTAATEQLAGGASEVSSAMSEVAHVSELNSKVATEVVALVGATSKAIQGINEAAGTLEESRRTLGQFVTKYKL